VLAASGTAAIEFYTDVLDEGATMLLPGGLTLTHRESVLLTMSDGRGRSTGWRSCSRAR
jgi:hypothetical protein